MATNLHVNAGVVEGFFGKPWSWSARWDAAAFLAQHGFRFYIYAPKADVQLRKRWREPMPAPTMGHLRSLRDALHRDGCLFGLGLSPFEAYLDYDAGSADALHAKISQLNELRIDLLCILFDDMRAGMNELAAHQIRIVDDIRRWSNAQRFLVCPTYYSLDVRLQREFGPPPPGYLKDLGRGIDASVEFFWTGEKVISAGYPEDHLDEVASELERKPFIWDNHISNDSRLRADRLFLDPAASGWHVARDRIAGLAVNPMSQPHLSRIALQGYESILTGQRCSVAQICRQLCGSRVGERLIEDLEMLARGGLDSLTSATRQRLLQRYESESDNPYARDLVDWLRGEYAFDPECLTL